MGQLMKCLTMVWKCIRKLKGEFTKKLYVICPLLKISLGNPYLKILDIANLFVADALRKKKSKI